MTGAGRVPDDLRDRINPTVPHSARIWNYWLGGKDYYAADREAGDKVLATYPGIREDARQARDFLARAVTHLAAECGVNQFLDIGTGLPTSNNTHEVAQAIDPSARIVYVDNDPIVLVHARALLTSTKEGACAYIDADARTPEHIVEQAGRTLDFTRPVGLMMLGVLGNVADYSQARSIVGQLVGAIPSGSFLVLEDGAATSEERLQATAEHNEGGHAVYVNRRPEEIAGFFEGLELLDPGVVPVSRWRPSSVWSDREPPAVNAYCGVARKP
ncbi:S-adenosyl methyltransferase [Pseudonocardia kunmingensis]|uniref:S-adenosyl methyltransferase n=1 Tax=Pseudonocardia kunmingensis TaxID=630975 RepID=A0A543DQW7_9PSEU|nr:S-adenosyl methyltransferase [Pseudonocardia kunmingensis]